MYSVRIIDLLWPTDLCVRNGDELGLYKACA